LQNKEKAFEIMKSLEMKTDKNDKKKTLYYNYACLYSLLNNKKDTLRYLTMALNLGYVNFNYIRLDTNLDNIRNNRSFKKIIENYKN
jgi:hypothetical protein